MGVRARKVISAAIVCSSITTPLVYGGVVSSAAPLDNINNDNHIVENIVTGAIKRYFNPLTVIQGGLKNPTALSKTYETYTVQEGDYLGGIAEKWNVSIEQLLLANNLDNPHQLRIGQTLKYPVPKFHRIQAGETIEMIAETHDVQLGQLYDANKLDEILPHALYVGQAIMIPEEIPEQMTRAFTYKPKTGTVKLASRSRSTSTDSSIPTFAWPLDGIVTSNFGKRWGKMHQGLDISHKNKSASIVAAGKGIVTTAGKHTGGYGLLVIIDHGDGVETWYAHLSKILVAEGDQVKTGNIIGKMGNTGDSHGHHLHFEVRKNGDAVNPINYLN